MKFTEIFTNQPGSKVVRFLDNILKAVIFDFDGVIVESMDIKTEAFKALFNDYPEHLDEIIRFHQAHGGMLRFEKFEIIYREILHQPLSESRMKELGEHFSKYVYKEVLKCPFVKGAYEFLEKYYLKKPLFIVSGTPHNEMQLIVKERNLVQYFKEVYGAPPDKGTLILKILKDYKFNPLDVLFVGDSIDDYEGAKRTGVKFIGRVAPGKENIFAEFNLWPVVQDIFELEGIIDGQKI